MNELTADAIVSGLLLLTTTWCILVYCRLQRLKVDREDLVASIAALNQAVGRAEDALAAIRQATMLADDRPLKRADAAELQERPGLLPVGRPARLGQRLQETLRSPSGAFPSHAAASPATAAGMMSTASPARGGSERATIARRMLAEGDSEPRPADASLFQRFGTLR